jgi:O-glycosyl hydrolase
LKTVLPVVAGHSYFTDKGDSTIVSVRSRLKDTAATYGVSFWQSEYSLLGDGYKEGKKGRVPAMDCALFLAKVIYHDLAVANATAWQFWNAWEPGRADVDTRYCLLALKMNAANTDGDYSITKNLWALGHYSRFIRPGMKRVVVRRSDGMDDINVAQELMISAFKGKKELVIVAVNYTTSAKDVVLEIPGVRKVKGITQYVTTVSEEDNLRRYALNRVKRIQFKPRSISTIVVDW